MKDLNKILEKILSLFKRYGTRSVTMDDIARELGISKKTLYQEFTDKDDLINRVIDFDMEQTRVLLDKAQQSGSNALQDLFLINRRMHSLRALYSPTFYFDLKRYYPEIYQRWIEDKRSSLYRVITKNLKKGKKQGLYRTEIDEHIIGLMHIARAEMFEANDIIDEDESRSDDFIREVFTYHLHGICNEQGLKLITLQRESFK